MVAGAVTARGELGAQLVSGHWYRVAGIKPRLRDHLKVHAHRYREQLWYVVEDRLNGKFHRFDAQAWRIMRLLDGRHALDAVWHQLADQADEDMPAQEDILALLGQLHAMDLLVSDTLPDLAEATQRGDKQARQKKLAQYLNPLAIRTRVWDPDRFLAALVARIGPWLTRWGTPAWLLCVLPALGLAIVHWQELTHNVGERLLAMDNLLLLVVLFPLVKALHELGHGVACKMRGGDVHDMGVMWLLFLPVPYVEASSSWAFPDKRDRMLVGAAGMLVEMVIAAMAFYLWLWLEPGVPKALAYDVAVLASVTTVLFNGNPLLRYDGYYVASDALEIPNLAQRASRYWGYLFERYAIRKRQTLSPAMARGEAFWFFLYAPLSLVYRVFVMISIAIFVSTQYAVMGMLMAVWSLAVSVVWPLGRSLTKLWGLANGPDTGKRGRRAALVLAVLVLLVLFVLPVPHRTQVEGVLWLPEEALVRAGQAGFVERLQVQPGSQVVQGQGLVLLRDPQLATQVQVQQARLMSAQVRHDAAVLAGPSQAGQASVAVHREETVLKRLQERHTQLTLFSGASGRLWLPASDDVEGRFIKKGQALAYVIPPKAPRVRVLVHQDDEDLIRQKIQSVRIKFPFDADRTWTAKVIRAVPGASRDLPSAALGKHRGGEVLTDPRDETGRTALQSHFEYELSLPDDFPFHLIGSRASVRFEHPPEAIGYRLWRGLRRMFLGYFHA